MASITLGACFCVKLRQKKNWLNPLMPSGNKRSYVFKQTCSFKKKNHFVFLGSSIYMLPTPVVKE